MRAKESSWACDFSGFFELRIKSCDHSDSGNIADSVKKLAYTFPLDMEPFDNPISRSDGFLESKGNKISIFSGHIVGNLDCIISFPFVQFLAKNSLQLAIVRFKKIFKQQFH